MKRILENTAIPCRSEPARDGDVSGGRPHREQARSHINLGCSQIVRIPTGDVLSIWYHRSSPKSLLLLTNPPESRPCFGQGAACRVFRRVLTGWQVTGMWRSHRMNDQANSVNKRYVEATPATLSSWNRQDTTWMLGLFGTAIGAGTLFCRSTQAWAVSGRC